jgi:hypothetical protein
MVKKRNNKTCEGVIETLKKQGMEVIDAEELKEAGIPRKKRRKKKN